LNRPIPTSKNGSLPENTPAPKAVTAPADWIEGTLRVPDASAENQALRDFA
jgi:hypothetical protein